MKNKELVLDLIIKLREKNVSDEMILNALLTLNSEDGFYEIIYHLLQDLDDVVI